MDTKKWTFIAFLFVLANAELREEHITATVQSVTTTKPYQVGNNTELEASNANTGNKTEDEQARNASETAFGNDTEVEAVNSTLIGDTSWNATEAENESNTTSNETAFEMIMSANSEIGELPRWYVQIFRKVRNIVYV
jgi:hypothetical protein